MHIRLRHILVFVAILATTGPSWSQYDEPPKVLKRKEPTTRKELDERESLYEYGRGLTLRHEEKLDDALKAFENSARLDRTAAAPVKEQVRILLALDRYGDALNACKRVVALDPGDYAVWFIQAKLYKSVERYPEAIAALENGVRSVAIKDHPEAAQSLYSELGSLYETVEKYGAAADAYNQAATILEHPAAIMEKGPIPEAIILTKASETQEKIAQLYRKAKRYDDTVTALRKAQKDAPERAGRLNFLLAQVFDEQGNLKDALKNVDAYLQTGPISTESHEMKISLLKRLQQTDAIVPWLEKVAERDRFNSELQLLLAREYVNAGSTAKAEAAYQKLAEETPSAEAYRGLFNIYKKDRAGTAKILVKFDEAMGKAGRDDGPAPAGAVQHARAMVGALREDGELARSLVETAFRQKRDTELKYETVYYLAILADKHRKHEEAERFYRQCLQSKDLPPANEVVLYSGLLRVLNASHKYEAAITVCRDGLAKSQVTNPLVFHREMARALAGLKKYDEALRAADQGGERAGDDNRLLFQILRVRILSMAQRYEDAEKECEALLKKHERPADAVELRYVLSNVYSAAKQHAKAEEQLQMILKIDPDNATVNNDLGYSWADQSKNLPAAEEMIRKAIELDRSQRRKNPNLTADDDKDNAAYVDSLGWVLFRRGKVDEARKELERATTLADSDDPVIYDHLGDVYSRLQMRVEARRAWERAIELYEQGVRRDEERVREIRHKIEAQ